MSGAAIAMIWLAACLAGLVVLVAMGEDRITRGPRITLAIALALSGGWTPVADEIARQRHAAHEARVASKTAELSRYMASFHVERWEMACAYAQLARTGPIRPRSMDDLRSRCSVDHEAVVRESLAAT